MLGRAPAAGASPTDRTRVEGRVWKFGDDINTDLIFPNTAIGLAPSEQSSMVFSANRPGWSALVEHGDILVAGRNFGVGSGRPVGQLLGALGITGIIAASINGLGLRNCISYGMPAVAFPGILDAVEEGNSIRVDFEAGTFENLTRGTRLDIPKIAGFLLDIVRCGGQIPLLLAEELVHPIE